MMVRSLRRHGFEMAFPTLRSGAFYATVRVPDPLPPDIAMLISVLFVQTPNPHLVL
jgi:hypothetical protein